MEIHVYDTSLQPDSVIVVSADITEENKQDYIKWVESIRAVIPGHQIISIPDHTVFESMTFDRIVESLMDIFTDDELLKLQMMVNEAVEKKGAKPIECE